MSTALVTGASSGIGRCTAITLATSYNLILSGRNVERLEQTKAQCLQANPNCQITLWPYDLSVTSNLEADFKAFLKDFRAQHQNEGINKFAHIAGGGKMKHQHLTTESDYLSRFCLHCISAALIIKILNSRANDKALDAVVLLSSHNSQRAVQGYGYYQASKAGAEAMARCLAVELAPRVRLNTVKAGLVQTPLTQEIFDNPELFKVYNEHCISGIAQPQDIANVVEFLLSDKARMITGEAIIADGGMVLDGSVHLRLGK